MTERKLRRNWKLVVVGNISHDYYIENADNDFYVAHVEFIDDARLIATTPDLEQFANDVGYILEYARSMALGTSNRDMSVAISAAIEQRRIALAKSKDSDQ